MKQPFYDLDGIESNFNSLYGEVSDFQIKRYNDLFNRFKDEFNEDKTYIASSSGRVEVCGNHTDHNGGKVIACTISLDTLSAFLPTDDNMIHIKSQGYPEIIVDINGENIEKKGTSPALVRGVIEGIKNYGYKVGGFKASFTSNVSGGAGISSSASFEVLVCEIINFLYNDEKITNEEKSKIAQFSEKEYFGKPCGLLDQTIIAFGGLKLLDFSDKEQISVKEINNDLSDYTLILINTGGSHSDLTDDYASIPAEMKMVAKAMGKERLIDVKFNQFLSELPEFYNKLPGRAILRAIHFYEENIRVDEVKSSLDNNDYKNFLRCIKESGISSMCKLQNCYSTKNLDQLIPKALSISSKYLVDGANRVHGGGFAGSILNVVKNEYKDLFIEKMKMYFDDEMILPLKVRTVGTIVL